MRYPNLRYGNPNEFAYYCQGIPIKEIAMRLQKMELDNRMYEMGMRPVRAKLGLVNKEAALYQFPNREPL